MDKVAVEIFRNQFEGVVEEITPRITRIRDRFGRLHILRNGEVKNVINYSRGWTLAVVDMAVAAPLPGALRWPRAKADSIGGGS